MTENQRAMRCDEDGRPLPPPKPVPPPRTLPGSYVIDYTPEDMGEQLAEQEMPDMQARLLAEYRRNPGHAAGGYRYDLEDIARQYGLDYGPPDHSPYTP